MVNNNSFFKDTTRFTLKLIGITCILFYFGSLHAEELRGRNAVIRGSVKNAQNVGIDFVTVYLKNTTLGTYSDENGNYFLRVPPGKYTLCAQLMGYAPFEQVIEIPAHDRTVIDIKLEEDQLRLEEVEVVAQSVVQQINKTAYNVVAVDAKALHNSNMDLANALDRISGVKIKEVGGVGSDAQITLNGFSGKHVKLFLDGVPLDGSGSAFGINNIPVNLADRIEVYKGVVPIELGADALGGAINIVTKNTRNTYVDASYTYGSFNTHKSNLSVGHTTSNGYTFQLNAYQNYSDNNYKIKAQSLVFKEVENPETGEITYTSSYTNDEHWFKRFHDTYHNEALIAKIGVRDKKWATRLLLETTLSQEKADIQNAYLMKVVYGGKERRAKSFIPALTYEKKNLFVENLNLSFTGRYNKVKSNSIDTLARQYNWAGEYIEKKSKGEGTYTLSENNNNSAYLTANINYRLGNKHSFALNNVFNTFSRKASSSVADEAATDATYMKRQTNKNVLGFSYKFDPHQNLNLSGFVKYYSLKVTGPINVSTTSTAAYEEQDRDYSTTGYGLAATYHLIKTVQFKGSFEKSYRLPTVNELFGDEVLETGDVGLKPEYSNNINFNISYNNVFAKVHSVYLDAGFVYRDTRDYIRKIVEQNKGGAYYANHGRVRNIGIDFEARYFYKNQLSIGGNLTWQDMTNRERYTSTGRDNIRYKDPMPNNPYLYSNVDATYFLYDVWGKGNMLSIGYNLMYVHEFYRSWKSERGSESIIIPEQLAHDITLTYALKNGRYNISLEGKNITDKLLYDNYSLQKPGRAFYIKFRYYFSKIK